MTDPNTLVLLVEDDDSLRGILARHLRSLGYAIVEATSCEAARAAIAHGSRPGLVLLDVNLPGDTGWDLLRGPELASAGSPPVVITSATAVNPRRLDEFGVAGYLPKPFPIETLVAIVERFLGGDR